MPHWASRFGVLVCTWLALVTAAALWLPHDWDWWAFARLASLHQSAFSDRVKIADVTWTADIPGNRRRIAGLLDHLVAGNQRPNAVIIDVEFESCHSSECGEPREGARRKLASSIRAAVRHFPIFALEQPAPNEKDATVPDPLIYDALSGAGHTTFTSVPTSSSVFYQTCYPHVPISEAGAGVYANIWSMVDRVFPSTPSGVPDSCEQTHMPVYLGPSVEARTSIVRPVTDAASIRRLPSFDGEYVIVGTVEHDRPDTLDRSGPELLGWALSNALDRQTGRVHRTYETMPQNELLLAVVPAFSGVAVVSFIAIFGVLRRVRLGRARASLPWLSAAAAAAMGLIAFATVETWLLFSREIQPQVTLIAFAVVVTAGLCGVRGYQSIADEESSIDVRPVDKFDYDVFISYAHEDGAWVAEHVYAPFRDATFPDGRKLSIFFDTSTIRGGTAWQEAIALSIDASRFVVPVYSANYFTKPYCRFEVRRAHRKWIGAGTDSHCVLPVMRGHVTIDRVVDDIQAVSIEDQPDIVQQYVRAVLERLG